MTSLQALLNQIQQASQLDDQRLALLVAQVTQTRFSFPHLQPEVDSLFITLKTLPVERRARVIAQTIVYLRSSRFLNGMLLDQMADMLMKLV